MRWTLWVIALALALGLSACTRETQPPKPANQPPVAALEFEPKWGQAPLTVLFSAASSFDPDGQISSYAWDFGDGSSGRGVFVEHQYKKKGSFVVTLTVTDDKGATSSAKRTVFVIEPSEPPPSQGRTDTAQNDFIVYSRTLPEAVKPGETFTVQVTITAKTALKAVVVSEDLPDGLQLVSGELRAAQLNLSPNQKLQWTYQVKAGAAPGTFTISGKATPATDQGAQPTLDLTSTVQIR
ncbi:MAG: PKD domain-containing protein [Candidatus Bipolaricaulota bacterium]|nr:PKD domain-containing protein [Candidatus Bipolaricaulota bacterium]MCS7274703.1 PKD domain-containing protein [Candidatus Bipolaricaulota bacterium]MDW8328947.1 PKD domain-containing protein [Candidatus Bipolaricaulota bacterium]